MRPPAAPPGRPTPLAAHEPERVSIAAIAALIGDDATHRLVQGRGGRRVHVPNAPREGHGLVELVGAEAALRLAWRFGGRYLQVPLRYTPRERVWTLLDEGLSVAAVAERLARTERWVYRVKAEGREAGRLPPRRARGSDPAQQTLFGDDAAEP